jgi:anti-sigma B factor antagonist
MFEIRFADDGSIRLDGRLDAAQAPSAQAFLDAVQGPCALDLAGLEYISSAGLGVLLRTHKRLMGKGDGLRLCNLSPHIREILRYSGFDRLFRIEPGPG